MTTIDPVAFDDASKFLGYLRGSHSQWRTGNWVFRGEVDHPEWQLMPSAWRSSGQQKLKPLLTAAKMVVEHIWDDRILPHYPPERGRTILSEAIAELEAVATFADLANAIGLSLPDRDKVKRTKDFIQEQCSGYEEGRGLEVPVFRSTHEVFGYAQHHGVPTRLLDWTTRALTAAFFAAENRHKHPYDLVVWALNLDAQFVDKYDGSHKRLYDRTVHCTRHDHMFLHRQDGLFLDRVEQVPEAQYGETGTWPDYAMTIPEHCGKAALRKITLDKHEAETLAEMLYHEDLTLAHLKPVFDNVALTAMERWPKHTVAIPGL